MFTHSRPFTCTISTCSNHAGFASAHDLARHMKSCHTILTAKTPKSYYKCAVCTKDKIWPRKDNFKAHLSGTHKFDDAEVARLLLE